MANSDVQKTYALFQTARNKSIISKFAENSTEFFIFPPLETEKNTLIEEQINFAKNVGSFDWLIFTDVLAVDYFLELLSENDVDFFELDAVRVCAFGEMVADRLRFSQIHADVVPTNINDRDIFSAINFYIGDNLNGLKILSVNQNLKEFELTNLLTNASAEVVDLPVYTVKNPDKSELVKLKTLLKGGAIDEFIFSAPEDLIALEYYFPSENELGEIFAEVKPAALDANIFQNLKENNFAPHYFTPIKNFGGKTANLTVDE